jgi:hypothetical protein
MSKVEWSSTAGGCVVEMRCVARYWYAKKKKRFVAWRGAVSNDEDASTARGQRGDKRSETGEPTRCCSQASPLIRLDDHGATIELCHLKIVLAMNDEMQQKKKSLC